MLTHADKTLSTDIHLIPFRNSVRVCFRTDTLLHDFPDPIPKAIYQAICNRIKLMSTIDIQPASIAQHGRFSVEIGAKMIEVRVCSQSTIHGDHVSLRLAEANAALKTIRELGFEQHEIDILQRSIDSDHGLTLVCGPTGSGKSTTLYATLFGIDRVKYSVMSGEDPVEREIPLVIQTEVSPPLTFDQYIAAALRRDPDYIMVGETRTEETAVELIRAAETGHVVYTTLHTNTAASAPHRLINLGIQPYMVADTLSSVIAQRLVPRLCPNCSFPASPPTAQDLEVNGISQSWFGTRSNFRDAHGCSQCNHTSFRGRILLAESFVVTPSAETTHLQQESLLGHPRGTNRAGRQVHLPESGRSLRTWTDPIQTCHSVPDRGSDSKGACHEPAGQRKVTMPEFQYLAIRPGEHKITKGVADRPSLQAFENDAIDRRLAVLKVERKREKEEEKVSRAKIPLKVKINFFQQMATCYKLQIHLAKAFDIIQDACANKTFKGHPSRGQRGN